MPDSPGLSVGYSPLARLGSLGRFAGRVVSATDDCHSLFQPLIGEPQKATPFCMSNLWRCKREAPARARTGASAARRFFVCQKGRRRAPNQGIRLNPGCASHTSCVAVFQTRSPAHAHTPLQGVSKPHGRGLGKGGGVEVITAALMLKSKLRVIGSERP